MDEVGDNEKHPIASLMETIGILISRYEDEHYSIPDASGVSVVKYLVSEQGFTQSELREIGTQGVVSEILSGKRELNVRQIEVLSKKFGVSPAVFFPR